MSGSKAVEDGRLCYTRGCKPRVSQSRRRPERRELLLGGVHRGPAIRAARWSGGLWRCWDRHWGGSWCVEMQRQASGLDLACLGGEPTLRGQLGGLWNLDTHGRGGGPVGEDGSASPCDGRARLQIRGCLWITAALTKAKNHLLPWAPRLWRPQLWRTLQMYRLVPSWPEKQVVTKGGVDNPRRAFPAVRLCMCVRAQRHAWESGSCLYFRAAHTKRRTRFSALAASPVLLHTRVSRARSVNRRRCSGSRPLGLSSTPRSLRPQEHFWCVRLPRVPRTYPSSRNRYFPAPRSILVSQTPTAQCGFRSTHTCKFILRILSFAFFF